MNAAEPQAADDFLLDFAGRELKTRATPKQARARQRVQAILKAAAEVLRQRAPSELSTSLIAARAEIPVSSVYRYFPTLEDLTAELYLQAVDELHTRLQALLCDAGVPNWRARLRAALDLILSFLSRHPYYSALLLRLSAQGGAQSVNYKRNADLVGLLAARWAQGDDGFSGGNARTVATVTVQMTLSLEELIAGEVDATQRELWFRELLKALERYLEPYFETGAESIGHGS